MGEFVDPDDPGLRQRPVQHPVVGAERGGMRHRRPRPIRSRAALEHDNRLGSCDAPRGLQEFRGPVQAFEIDKDRAGLIIVGQIIQHIGLIDIDGIAEPDTARDAVMLAGHDRAHHRAGEIAGLRDIGNRPFRDLAEREEA